MHGNYDCVQCSYNIVIITKFDSLASYIVTIPTMAAQSVAVLHSVQGAKLDFMKYNFWLVRKDWLEEPVSQQSSRGGGDYPRSTRGGAQQGHAPQ